MVRVSSNIIDNVFIYYQQLTFIFIPMYLLHRFQYQLRLMKVNPIRCYYIVIYINDTDTSLHEDVNRYLHTVLLLFYKTK